MSTQLRKARTQAPSPPSARPDPPAPRCCHLLTKSEAEDVLDWLEAHGLRGELSVDETGLFVVRCRG